MSLLFESGREHHQVIMVKTTEAGGVLDSNNEFTDKVS